MYIWTQSLESYSPKYGTDGDMACRNSYITTATHRKTDVSHRKKGESFRGSCLYILVFKKRTVELLSTNMQSLLTIRRLREK